MTRRMVRASVAQLRYILWDHDGVLVDTELGDESFSGRLRVGAKRYREILVAKETPTAAAKP